MCSGVAVGEGLLPDRVAGFDGTWVLANISDGRRSRDDVDESLTISSSSTHIHLDYAIADRYGKRRLVLDAPIDGSPATQTVQGRPCTVTVSLQGSTLSLELQRQASFGMVHNRRIMQLSLDGQSIESERSNFERDGRISSSWRETWLRRTAGALANN